MFGVFKNSHALFGVFGTVHSSHAITADVDIVETAQAAKFFLADGVVVTGPATGQVASVKEVRGQ